MDETNADRDWAAFQKRAYSLTGVDLRAYKAEQMRRRLGTLLARAHVETFAEYARLLTTDHARVEEFRDFVTINVSEFLRDPQKFEQLRRSVLQPALEQRRRLRVWSAGCSNGAEPYTVALLMREIDPAGLHDILATDIDRRILGRAERGDAYALSEVRNLSPQRLQRFFIRDGDTYSVMPAIRKMVRFRLHNLISDPFERNLDLIVCRNVVIYLTDEVKSALYRRFFEALRPGGVLFVGGTEVIHDAKAIGFDVKAPSFYGRPASSNGPSERPTAERSPRGVARPASVPRGTTARAW